MNQHQQLELFNEWRENEITKRFIKWCLFEEHLQRTKAALGECRKDSFSATAEEYIKTMIRAEALNHITTVEFEDLFPQEDTNESNSGRASTIIEG